MEKSKQRQKLEQQLMKVGYSEEYLLPLTLVQMEYLKKQRLRRLVGGKDGKTNMHHM